MYPSIWYDCGVLDNHHNQGMAFDHGFAGIRSENHRPLLFCYLTWVKNPLGALILAF